MAVKISQHQARAYRAEANRLKEVLDLQRRNWRKEWPGNCVLGRIEVGATTTAIVQTARRLGHAVVVVEDNGTLIMFGMEIAR
jgi:hypothetical protein